MSFEEISTAAFIAAPRDDRFVGTFYALTFPAHWRQIILDLYRHGKKNPDRRQQVPIRRVNEVIRTFAPDLVSVATNAAIDDELPWLYTTSKYPAHIIKALILSWLHDLQPSPDDYPLVRATQQQLAPQALDWDLVSVDLLEQQLSDGGTAIPAKHLYRLLPELLADRIAQLPDPYTFNDQQVYFRRVACEEQHAELMSWPPLERITTSKEQGSRTWSYSAYIRISLQTVPFSPVPRIHINTGIRRWVRGTVWMPADRGVTAYLLADSPWIWAEGQNNGGFTSTRFAAGKLIWSKRDRKVMWKASGPEGMLRRLTVNSDFPEADLLAKQPEEWLDRDSGVRAAVAYHTMMGGHEIGSGLMPSERRRLTEWAAAALEPDFRRAPNLTRSALKATPKRTLRKKRSIPKPESDPTSEKTAKAAAANEKIAAANSLLLRTLTAEAVDGQLSCHVLYQTDECREELIRAAEESLGLSQHRIDAPNGVWEWHTPELQLKIYTSRLGGLGGPLGGAKPPRTRQQTEDAVTQRRREVSARLETLAQPSQVVFVELDDRRHWKPRSTDPKFAIRLGCVDAGRVSQFISTFRPEKPTATEASATADGEQDDSGAHRADATWGDGLRQVGVRFVPVHTLGKAIPDSLNQLAFWMIKRRSDGAWFKPQFTPIAILIRPGQNTILGRTADMDSWVPYPRMLRELTGRVRSNDLKTKEQQQAEAARFVRRVLYSLRNEQTVAVTFASNSREYVPWLQNAITVPDLFQLGSGPVQRLTLQGRTLRLIRVRGGDRAETPQWWAPKASGTAGISKGLWLEASEADGRRVFHSTMDKSSTHHIELDATKLTTRIKIVKVKDKETGKEKEVPKTLIDSHKNAWNPQLLEIAVLGHPEGESPEAWAMFLHQQRQTDDNRDGLGLPLILHLAELAGEYALPHEEPAQASPEDDSPELPTDLDTYPEAEHEGLQDD